MTRGGALLSIRGSITIFGLTAGDGPWAIYILNADLSSAEFEAYLETLGPVHPDDTTAVEVASRGRKIRYLGLLVPSGNGTVGGLALKDVSLSGLRFSEEAAGWQYAIYNLGAAMQTGASWTIRASNFVRWNKGG